MSLRLPSGFFSSSDAHGKSKGQGGSEQEHNVPRMAAMHERPRKPVELQRYDAVSNAA